MVNRGDDKTRHNRGQGLHYDIDLSIILLAKYYIWLTPGLVELRIKELYSPHSLGLEIE